MCRALFVFAVVAGCLNASTGTFYSIPSGFSDGDGPVSGTVLFGLSNCVTGSSPSCTLNIAITDTEANPKGAGQLLSGLSFLLQNAGTTLPDIGTLSDTINNDSNGNGTGGAVTVLSASLTTTTTTSKPGTWQFGTVSQEGQGKAGFDLTTLTGGSPENMIIGPGPYTNANSSITGHSPSLAGTVDFSISDFPGLTTSTVLSDVNFFFGTGPDASEALTCTSGCSGTISTGVITATPEPFSLFLAGGALIAIGLLRRRSPHRPDSDTGQGDPASVDHSLSFEQLRLREKNSIPG